MQRWVSTRLHSFARRMVRVRLLCGEGLGEAVAVEGRSRLDRSPLLSELPRAGPSPPPPLMDGSKMTSRLGTNSVMLLKSRENPAGASTRMAGRGADVILFTGIACETS